MPSVDLTEKAIILVVEDEAFLRMAAVYFVEEAGFEALEAGDADAAIALLESRSDIRLVFTDIDMPAGSMNGLKLAQAVRDRWPPIAIIVASGHRIPAEIDMPFKARFFPKPYDEANILKNMRELLEAA